MARNKKNINVILVIAIILSLMLPFSADAALTQVEVENAGTFYGTWTTTTGTLYNFDGNIAPMYSQVVYRVSSTENDYYELTIPSGNTSLSVVMKNGNHSTRCIVSISDPVNGTQIVSGFNPKDLSADKEDYPAEYLITNNLSNYGAGPYTLRITVGVVDSGKNVAIDCVKYGDFNFGSITVKMYPPTYAKSHYGLGACKIGIYQGSSLITYGFTNTDRTTGNTIYGLNTGTYTVKSVDAKWGISTEQTVSVTAGNTTSVPDLYAVGHRIWSPGPAKPEIRKPKESFNVEFFGSSNCGSFTATLSNEYKTYAIPIEKVSYNPTWNMHTLKATIQSNVVEALYTLTVNSSEGNDSVVRAVKVVKNYKSNFYFVHSSDDHTIDYDTGLNRNFQTKIELWNIIHPEFAIFTGDNVKGDGVPGVAKFDSFMSILNKCEIPTFVVAGNHDRESETISYNRKAALLYWGAACYSRNYGPYHFTGLDWDYVLNEGDQYGWMIDPEWINWLRNDWSKAQGAKLRIFGVHSYYYYDTASADWSTYRINMILKGHDHYDDYKTVGTTPTIDIKTKAGFYSCYRLIRIKDNSFVSWWYDDDTNKKQSVTGQWSSPEVNYTTAQDGSVESSTATITNYYKEEFENAQIKFIVKRGTYTATGGTVINMIHSDDKTKTVVYVNVDIAKQSTQTVSITRVGDAIDEGITAKINYKEGGTVSVTGFKGEVRLDIPALTFDKDITLTLNTEPDLPAITGQGEYKGTNVGVEITAAAEGEIKYLKAMTLTVGYKNEDIVGLDENKLSIAYYNTREKKWMVLPSKVYADSNKVETTVTHFSIFQVVEYGTPTNLDNVRVYPNPYQPSKHAQINFMGLTATSVIKIYTINGEKVNEISADVRGNAIWDSNNSSGEKVGSGIYLGYITDGTNKKTVKICIER